MYFLVIRFLLISLRQESSQGVGLLTSGFVIAFIEVLKCHLQDTYIGGTRPMADGPFSSSSSSLQATLIGFLIPTRQIKHTEGLAFPEASRSQDAFFGL